MNRRVLEACGLAVILGSTGWAQVTQRVSVDSGGAQGDNLSTFPTISADGRFIAFASAATDLVAGDTNGFFDVFVRDRQSGTTERVSISSTGTQGNGDSGDNTGGTRPGIAISGDGRFVAFWSFATNLVTGDTNGFADIFVRDRQAGTTELVSIGAGGVPANNYSVGGISISADGRYVAFASVASNLVAGDTNHFEDIFVRDRQSGTTEIVSVGSSGGQGDFFVDEAPSISADGRYVAFPSYATNLVPSDTNGWLDIFVHDRQSGTTERVSVDSAGAQVNGPSAAPSISADGRYVAFCSNAPDLVAGDTNGHLDVFVRDRQASTTERVSVDSGGVQGDNDSYNPSISADGRFAAFYSIASNLVAGGGNGHFQTCVRDRQSGTTTLSSANSSGVQGIGDSMDPSISGDGRWVVFDSTAANLVSGDTNGVPDVFLRDRHATGFTSLCDPAVGGVIACPCANPPGGPGRGCDNSAATGGAALSASGIAYLSMDSLVFATSGEKPTATSILLQGPASPPAGVTYGQGVRCVGGSLKRLFVKAAVGGSISAPDFGAGDPTVSARSAAKGDVIQPGQSRWYLVYYRDPTVLGGCPASSTFNATQTGRIDWSF